jgi:hypothetical protein
VIAKHLQTFLWLRWRLLVNQLRRGGVVSAVFLGILIVAVLLLAAVLFAVSFLLGLFLLADSRVSPTVLMLVWDGLVVFFLFCWGIGLLTELQRSEVLSLDKFLHLPVSLTGAFLINYVSSLLSVTLILFVPAMFGLALGLAFGKGPAMFLLLPLLAAFLLMVTALTYQFQSWLASLMANKRRRRSIIVMITVAFILLCQAPQLFHLLQPRARRQMEERRARLNEQEAELQRDLKEKKITLADLQRRRAEIANADQARQKEENDRLWEQVKWTAQLVNTALPPGWLPLGALGAAEGTLLPPVLGMLGLTLLGAGSLWRSYKTTVRLYTGHYTGGKARAAPAPPTPAKPAERPEKAAGNPLERELPWVSGQAAVVALAGFRSLLRAPEAKMLLLTPVILVVVFGSILFANAIEPPPEVRPLMAYGTMAAVLFCMAQLVGNQFGFDRSGFRVFVLSPAPRREIILGKNLAVAPLVVVLGVAAVACLEVVYPMPVASFLACLPQLLSMFLVFCLLANCLSVLAPLRIQPGTMKPVNYKVGPFLFHLAFLFLCPLALAPTLLPLGVEALLEALGWGTGGAVYLVLSLAECVAVVYLYRRALTWQGDLLQAREQKVLETVTTREE